MTKPILPAWHFLLACLAGWTHREQQQRVEFLQTQLAVVLEMLGKKRLRFNDDQRRRLPPQSPNLNSFAERWVRSIKSECLEKMIFFGEKMFRHAVCEFVRHFHAERNHQGLENKIIQPDDSVGQATGEIVCRERLGGLLKYYHRLAA